MKRSVSIALTLACALAVPTRASDERQFFPSPAGSVVERQLVAFNGEGIADRWPAVLSKRRVGSDSGRDFYQWYLSIYQLRRGAYRLRYESPGNGAPLSRVTQGANGSKMWFPTQEASLVGVGTLMRAGVQQLVVRSHETGADCGGATITVFATKPGNTVGPVVTITNPCDLDASLVSGGGLQLTGPYYGKNAPLCCPTKANATATLRYRNGKWVETPNYFKVEEPGTAP